MLLKSHVSLTSYRACFLPGRAKDSSAPGKIDTRGYMNKPKCMTNTYYIHRQTWKWMKTLSFHFLHSTNPNSIAILTSCGSNMSQWQCKLASLVKDIIRKGKRVNEPQTTQWVRQTPSISQPQTRETQHNQHRPLEERRIWWHVCSAENAKIRPQIKYQECKAGLCAGPCFKTHHNESHFGAVTPKGELLRMDIPLRFKVIITQITVDTTRCIFSLFLQYVLTLKGHHQTTIHLGIKHKLCIPFSCLTHKCKLRCVGRYLHDY